MAPTRFYLSSVAVAAVTPTPDTEWENTTTLIRRKMSPTKGNSAYGVASASSDGVTTSNRDTLIRQFVSDPIAAGVIAGTFKGQIQAFESSTANNYRAQIILRVVSNDGTVERGVLYAGELTTGTGDPASEFALIRTNRSFPRAGAITLSPVTAQTNDRVVAEVGARKHAAASTASPSLTIGDLTANADLPENETDATTTKNPWLEFSDDLFTTRGTTHQGTGDVSLTTTASATGKRIQQTTGTSAATLAAAGTGRLIGRTTGAATITGSASANTDARLIARSTGAGTATIMASATGKRTQRGTGAAAATVTAAATGRRIQRGDGAASALVAATGAGRLLARTTGAGTVTVTASATGKLVQRGAGATAAAVSATGAGRLVARGTGAAMATTSATAAATRLQRATGSASALTAGSGTGRLLARGTGAAGLVVTGAGSAGGVQPGTGEVAASFGASGSGRVIARSTGAAAALVVPVGEGRRVQRGTGAAVATLTAAAEARRVLQGSGGALATFDALGNATALYRGIGDAFLVFTARQEIDAEPLAALLEFAATADGRKLARATGQVSLTFAAYGSGEQPPEHLGYAPLRNLAAGVAHVRTLGGEAAPGRLRAGVQGG